MKSKVCSVCGLEKGEDEFVSPSGNVRDYCTYCDSHYVEELLEQRDAQETAIRILDAQNKILRDELSSITASIKDAISDMEDSMQSADYEVASTIDGMLLILRSHGFQIDKGG
jgi:hypothetical protein